MSTDDVFKIPEMKSLGFKDCLKKVNHNTRANFTASDWLIADPRPLDFCTICKQVENFVCKIC